MVQILISLTLFVVSFCKQPIPSEERCNKINKCYNPITQECSFLAPCPKIDYCNGLLKPICGAYPNAQCKFNGCGECNTYFVDTFDQIIRNCDDNICTLPAETGICRAAFPRYYFNDETQACEEFIYGGCKGNENNFETLYECQQICNNIIPNCVPKGGSFMGDPETCTLIDFICGLDEDYWFDDKCGCGCKPKKIDIPDCVPDGWYYSGDNDFCVVAFIVCKDGYEHWSLPECGCGCKPKDINPPSACPLDIKKCSDGSYVNRNPLNNCEFDECPKCNQIKCLIEPCQFSSCDNYPNAICTSNYCNSCNAIWTDINGNDITNKCIKTTTTTTIKPQCVPDNWIFIGDNDLCSRILFDCDENS
eukprot:164448_1